MHGIDLLQDLAVVLLVGGAVGWICHRIGLSLIVGYLGAGMLIGPYTPPFSLVTDVHRIETLSQLGLVFLMFGIGLHLSLRRLKRLGLPLVVATVVNTVLIYYLARLLGAAMHWNATETLFVGAMLMISSSAIIGKILIEVGATHEKVGQAAMSLTVMEDVVAVVMLTVLGSLTKMGGAHGSGGGTDITETIGLMGSFVVLAGVLTLLFVPWLLRRLSVAGTIELQTLCMSGLLLGLAVIAARAGYSLALGAFLLGCIVAETAQKAQVERTFEGLHDVFSAVFFVAIGMQIDVRLMADAAWLIVIVSAFSLLFRPLTCAAGFVLAGTPPRDAFRVGLVATPIGEFSLIIAQLGVSAAVIPAKFYPMAVGVSLLTSLVSPSLTRHSAAIADFVLSKQPRWMSGALAGYQEWLQRLQVRGQQSELWQLSRKRLLQVGLEAMLVSGLLLFSESLYELGAGYFQGDSEASRVLFWSVLGLVALLPLVAIWRNICTLAMIVADFTTTGHPTRARLSPIIETALKAVAGVLIFLWLSAILPTENMSRWVPVAALVVAAVTILLLRSKLIYWHSIVEVELQERFVESAAKPSATNAPWLAQHGEWQLSLSECVLPDLADVRGSTLRELGLRPKFGVVVAGIERQGCIIANPTEEMALFPHDKVLLLGEPKQIAACKAHLRGVSGKDEASDFAELRMEAVPLPPGSALAGRTLAELGPTRRVGVQVAGIHRGGLRILNPGGDEKLLPGDDVLVLGRPDQIAAFKVWARPTGRSGKATVEIVM